MMPETGTKVARIEPDRLKNSTLPLRTWVSRSVSEPSWLAGNSLISSRPPVASRMRSIASWSRVLIGCVGVLAGGELPAELGGGARPRQDADHRQRGGRGDQAAAGEGP